MTGRNVGGSTGTNLWGALMLAREMAARQEPGSIATLICDQGERYAHTYYDDGWLREQGLDLAPFTAALECCLATGEWRED